MYNNEQNNYYNHNSEDGMNNYQQGMNNTTYSTDGGYQQQTADASYYQQDNNGKKEKKPSSGFGKKMTRCAAYALAFGLVAGTAFEGSSYAMQNLFGTKQSAQETSTSQTDKTLQTTSVSSSAVKSISSTDVSDIVKNVMPSIVAITNMSQVQYQSFFGGVQNYESESAGSGFIVNEDDTYLYIVTNNHVVEGADTLTVQFNDDSTASAEVQGTDSTNDLAVVKVKKSDMEDGSLENVKVATLGDSDGLQVGEASIAIGNALGYGQSVTTGVISALERQVTITDETTGQTVSSKLIQTDAAINPGNSGGALLNANGEVIGINSSKYSDTTVEGMGFAIPISTAKPIIEELISTGKSTIAQGAYLGIHGVDVTSDVSAVYNIPEGAYITQILDNSAAAEAGLSQGDIITKIDDTSVKSFEELKSAISAYRAGDEVTVVYERRNEKGEYTENTVKITLGEYTEEDTQSSSNEQGSDSRNDSGSRRGQQQVPDDNGSQGSDLFPNFNW